MSEGCSAAGFRLWLQPVSLVHVYWGEVGSGQGGWVLSHDVNFELWIWPQVRWVKSHSRPPTRHDLIEAESTSISLSGVGWGRRHDPQPLDLVESANQRLYGLLTENWTICSCFNQIESHRSVKTTTNVAVSHYNEGRIVVINDCRCKQSADAPAGWSLLTDGAAKSQQVVKHGGQKVALYTELKTPWDVCLRNNVRGRRWRSDKQREKNPPERFFSPSCPQSLRLGDSRLFVAAQWYDQASCAADSGTGNRKEHGGCGRGGGVEGVCVGVCVCVCVCVCLNVGG